MFSLKEILSKHCTIKEQHRGTFIESTKASGNTLNSTQYYVSGVGEILNERWYVTYNVSHTSAYELNFSSFKSHVSWWVMSYFIYTIFSIEEIVRRYLGFHLTCANTLFLDFFMQTTVFHHGVLNSSLTIMVFLQLVGIIFVHPSKIKVIGCSLIQYEKSRAMQCTFREYNLKKLRHTVFLLLVCFPAQLEGINVLIPYDNELQLTFIPHR